MVEIEMIKGFEALPNGKLSCAEVKITSYVIRKLECHIELYTIILPEMGVSPIKNMITDCDSIIITFADIDGAERVLDKLMEKINKYEQMYDNQDVAVEMTQRLWRIMKSLKFKYCKSKWYRKYCG